ncbi:hypothetical protein EPO15_13075, partial [bacterium]
LGLSQLARWPELESCLESVRDRYTQALVGHPHLRLPSSLDEARPGWSYFSVRADGGRARALARHLRARGVDAVAWAPPAHLFALYRSKRRLPVAEAYWKDFVDLPFSTTLTAAEAERCADALSSFRG